ncbi:MAG: response regulator [Myxococcota bacterium]
MTTVLVVEDDAVYRGALARALRREGFVPIEADGVETANAVLADVVPTYAVVDLALTDGSGIDVLHTLAARAPGCRSLLLTAHGTIPAAVEAMRAGAVDFRTKPISTAELVETLRRSDDVLRLRDNSPRTGLPDELDGAERQHIVRILEACEGNVSEAARRLGLHRRTLQRKLQKLPSTR